VDFTPHKANPFQVARLIPLTQCELGMDENLIFVLIFVGYLVLQLWILPKMGVST